MQILEDGVIGADCYMQVWNASETETTYFWTEEFLIEERDLTEIDGNIEDLIEEAGVYFGKESAEMALASERTNLRRVVLMLDSNDLDPELLSTDDSCENMEHCYQYSGLIPIDKIKKVWIDPEPLDLFALFFIGMAVSRNESNGWIRVELGENEKLPSTVLEASGKLYEAMWLEWLENISYSFELEEYYKDENGTLINSYSHYPLIEQAN